MITSPAALARNLSELCDTIRTLPLDEPFIVRDMRREGKLPPGYDSNRFVNRLKKFGVIKKVAHSKDDRRWELTRSGKGLVLHLNGKLPQEEKGKPVPKYVAPIKKIIAKNPSSAQAISKELGIYPGQLRASFRYLQQKGQARHVGSGSSSRWELVQVREAAVQ